MLTSIELIFQLSRAFGWLYFGLLFTLPALLSWRTIRICREMSLDCANGGLDAYGVRSTFKCKRMPFSSLWISQGQACCPRVEALAQWILVSLFRVSAAFHHQNVIYSLLSSSSTNWPKLVHDLGYLFLNSTESGPKKLRLWSLDSIVVILSHFEGVLWPCLNFLLFWIC